MGRFAGLPAGGDAVGVCAANASEKRTEAAIMPMAREVFDFMIASSFTEGGVELQSLRIIAEILLEP